MIALENVSYTYPHSTTAALCGVSLRVAGLDVAPTSAAAIAAQAGTLFQDPERQFFALTADDEIALALQWRNWPPERVRQAVGDSMERLGITDLAGRSVFGLSEGQKQKVALAGLLAGEPKVLLLDEPSANLDPESTRDLAHTLCRLKAQGLTLLIVDYRLWWLRDVVDDVLVLDAGRGVAQGDFSLFSDNALRTAHGLRSHEVEDMVAGHGAAVVVITHDPEFIKEACTRQLLIPSSETVNAHHGGAA